MIPFSRWETDRGTEGLHNLLMMIKPESRARIPIPESLLSSLIALLALHELTKAHKG